MEARLHTRGLIQGGSWCQASQRLPRSPRPRFCPRSSAVPTHTAGDVSLWLRFPLPDLLCFVYTTTSGRKHLNPTPSRPGIGGKLLEAKQTMAAIGHIEWRGQGLPLNSRRRAVAVTRSRRTLPGSRSFLRSLNRYNPAGARVRGAPPFGRAGQSRSWLRPLLKKKQ